MINFIAEAGVNHNGSEDMAIDLIDAAIDSGADYIKFQTFITEKIVTKDAQLADYQALNTSNIKSQYQLLKSLELSQDIFRHLADYCSKKNIEFLSTAFDSDSLFFLINELGLKKLKISSGDLTNSPFLLEHACSNCDLILSTGMSSLRQVKNALGVIAYGFVGSEGKPSQDAFKEAYESKEGKEALASRLTLLHCTSDYPASIIEANLSVIPELKKELSIPIGYSDHTLGIDVAILAAALGSVIIEKHITLDKSMDGPDHKASLNPVEFKDMIEKIKIVTDTLGKKEKNIQPSEINNSTKVRKSLVAAAKIKKGEKFTSENIIIKRPGDGISPHEFWDYMGKKAERDYDEDEQIK